ncbi:hypothetical protein BDF19DRAFT_432599 [Syncephalis fuscata]|nr:hypothetical protein BDF19DRAFT_432599 [Syncephalis fuscata]
MIMLNSTISVDQELIKDMERLLHQSHLLNRGSSRGKAKLHELYSANIFNKSIAASTTVMIIPLLSTNYYVLLVSISLCMVWLADHLDSNLGWYELMGSCIIVSMGILYILTMIMNRLSSTALHYVWVELLESSCYYDRSMTRIVRSIQEMELIARGYQLTGPLPPISRIEQQTGARYGLDLRLLLHRSLKNMVNKWAAIHETLCFYSSSANADEVTKSQIDQELSLVQDWIDVTESTVQEDALKKEIDPLSLHIIRQIISATFEIRCVCLMRARNLLAINVDNSNNHRTLWQPKQSKTTITKYQMSKQLYNMSQYLKEQSDSLKMVWDRQHDVTNEKEEQLNTSENVASNDRRRPSYANKTKLLRDDILLMAPSGLDEVQKTGIDLAINNPNHDLIQRLTMMGTEAQLIVQSLEQMQKLTQQLVQTNGSLTMEDISTDTEPLLKQREPTWEEIVSAEEIKFDWDAPPTLEPIGDEQLFEAIAGPDATIDGKVSDKT